MASDFNIGHWEEDDQSAMADDWAIQKLVRRNPDLMNMAREVNLDTVLKEERKEQGGQHEI